MMILTSWYIFVIGKSIVCLPSIDPFSKLLVLCRISQTLEPIPGSQTQCWSIAGLTVYLMWLLLLLLSLKASVHFHLNLMEKSNQGDSNCWTFVFHGRNKVRWVWYNMRMRNNDRFIPLTSRLLCEECVCVCVHCLMVFFFSPLF